jgi:hypothetical protein
LIIGSRMRLTMKAGKSSATGGLAQLLRQRARRAEGRLVGREPRMISTSFIIGTGFMKCMPMKRGPVGRRREARDRDRGGVGGQMIASGFSTGQSAAKIFA